MVLDDVAIRRALVRIAHEVVERNETLRDLYLVAIPNGGVPLARIIAAQVREITGLEVPVGILDTTLYRDDLIARGERPPLRRTEMPSAVDDRVVVLVDDVVSTGRTIRAAMDALMDFGRPALGAGGRRSSTAATASCRSRSTSSARTSRRSATSASCCAASRATSKARSKW